MNCIETDLPGILILEPKVYGDERGFFLESYNRKRFEEIGIDNDFVQDNHSASVKGTLRGLHYQRSRPQAKLCRVITGAVLDVAVDIRPSSSHFGRWTTAVLSAENKRQIWVPAGFAHGFLVLTDRAEFLYKCDEFYDPTDERGIAWDDPDLAINWQLTELGDTALLLSAKDRSNPLLRDLGPDDLPT
jgi:dTDP-4-dehydrorhamnose 3,5-epimerase